MTVIKTSCPLDCFAHCGLLALVESGRVVDIKGDPDHPLTRGKVCIKAKKLLQRLYSPQRLLTPMERHGESWRPISWDDAYNLMAEKLLQIREKFDPQAVLYHTFGGSEGLLHNLEMRFFNAFGGCSLPDGCICWSTGYTAQQIDFGSLRAHDWEDYRNSSTIILWGRDPLTTNIHLVPHLKTAREKGAFIIIINPNKVPSVKIADLHISPRPGTDGALALGMAREIINKGLYDKDFVTRHCSGFDEFYKETSIYTTEHVAEICGISKAEIEKAAEIYATRKPSAIILGFGMQRYANGGQTVRAIDALGALGGNLGISGGGVSYGNQYWKNFFGDISGSHLDFKKRKLPWPTLANEILNSQEPPVKACIVTRSNPMTQLPDTNKLSRAFSNLSLMVVSDFFLTDTARAAHLVLPCTTSLEEEDLFCCSWNPYLNYAARAVEPMGQCKPDWVIFSQLAEKMALPEFPSLTARQWMEKILEPVRECGFTLENLAKGPVKNPRHQDVPWQERAFDTPSGRFEFYSQKALSLGLPPVATYREPAESPVSRPDLAAIFPLHFITSHHRDFLHSQFYNLVPEGDCGDIVHINSKNALQRGIVEGQRVKVLSPRGEMTGTASITDSVRQDVVVVYSGRWHGPGGGVNSLTAQQVPDMGLGTPYYDCLCQVEPM